MSLEWRQDMERYRWRQVSDGGAWPRVGLIVPDPETFQPEAYKPVRFRMRTKFNVAKSLVVSALKAATTSKLAGVIQVRGALSGWAITYACAH
jgi:hypothetical protein